MGITFDVDMAEIDTALTRISRHDFLGGKQGPFVPSALLALLAGILVYDLLSLRKIHGASLVAVVFAIALNLVGTRISQSGFGLAFICSLA